MCYPPEWFSPAPFEPPWSGTKTSGNTNLNWYSASPGPEYPRLGATVNGCGRGVIVPPPGTLLARPEQVREMGMILRGVIPSQGPPGFSCPTVLAPGENMQPQICNDSTMCPVFTICDYRYGDSGKCSKPNLSGQASQC